MIQVYHNENAVSGDTYFTLINGLPLIVYASQLQCVAEVETDDLDIAYALTSAKEHYWWINELVTPTFSGSECRGTTIGDVLLLNGNYYAVAPVGFVPVEIQES